MSTAIRLGGTDIRHARRARLLGLVRQRRWAHTRHLVEATGRDQGEVSNDLHRLAELGAVEHPAHGVWCVPGTPRLWPLTAQDVRAWLEEQWEPVAVAEIAHAFGVLPSKVRRRLRYLQKRGEALNLHADEPFRPGLWVAS